MTKSKDLFSKIQGVILTNDEARSLERVAKTNKAVKKLLALHSLFLDSAFIRSARSIDKMMNTMESAVEDIDLYFSENEGKKVEVPIRWEKDENNRSTPIEFAEMPFKVSVYADSSNKIPERLRIIGDDMFACSENLAKLVEMKGKAYVPDDIESEKYTEYIKKD